ncbi:Hypothetical_protein [Hexamita inflata]|uniref:Hypothetical_protein n=1 Tax=Hexamita inflata TaxID=28002 RepID=A0AA86UBM9_9EUKA|nr:Hypothetical protein HINF_LOCUS32507 [Hexamita inflata]
MIGQSNLSLTNSMNTRKNLNQTRKIWKNSQKRSARNLLVCKKIRKVSLICKKREKQDHDDLTYIMIKTLKTIYLLRLEVLQQQKILELVRASLIIKINLTEHILSIYYCNRDVQVLYNLSCVDVENQKQNKKHRKIAKLQLLTYQQYFQPSFLTIIILTQHNFWIYFTRVENGKPYKQQQHGLLNSNYPIRSNPTIKRQPTQQVHNLYPQINLQLHLNQFHSNTNIFITENLVSRFPSLQVYNQRQHNPFLMITDHSENENTSFCTLLIDQNKINLKTKLQPTLKRQRIFSPIKDNKNNRFPLKCDQKCNPYEYVLNRVHAFREINSRWPHSDAYYIDVDIETYASEEYQQSIKQDKEQLQFTDTQYKLFKLAEGCSELAEKNQNITLGSDKEVECLIQIYIEKAYTLTALM